ncbi:MAG: hypothetical protein ACFCGT_09650 [Sandaracinaceae bacterium]
MPLILRCSVAVLGLTLLGCVQSTVLLGGNLQDSGPDVGGRDGATRDAALPDLGRDAGPLDLGADAGPAGALAVVPDRVRFDHVVGLSPCPQRAGTARLASTFDVPVAWVVEDVPAYLILRPAAGSLPAGSATDVVVEFTCMDIPGVPFLFVDDLPIAHDGGGEAPTLTVDGSVRAR